MNLTASIENCWAFRCPQQWAALQLTDDPEVRFCPVCQQSVYLCTSDRDFLERAQQGHCVAVPMLPPTATNGPPLTLIPRPLLGMPLPPARLDRDED